MIIKVSKHKSDNTKFGKEMIVFNFLLEENDNKISKDWPANHSNIRLEKESIKFYFPFKYKLAHIDSLAYVALNLIYPFIGNRFTINNGVSPEFAESIKKYYDKIEYIKIDNKASELKNFSYKESAISFSTGMDSVAAAILDNDQSLKLLLAKVQGNRVIDKKLIKSFKSFKQNKKYTVMTDQHTLVVNIDHNYNQPAGNYSFINHAILLTDHFNLKYIITGDIMDAFNKLGTKFLPEFAEDRIWNTWKFIGNLNIKVDSITKWVSEIVTSKIVFDKFGFNFSTNSCIYFHIKTQCNNCEKCFRKLLIKGALSDFKYEDLETLNNSKYIAKWNSLTINDENKWHTFATNKYCAEKINGKYNLENLPELQKFVDFYNSVKYNINWVYKIDKNSTPNVPNFLDYSYRRLLSKAELMNDSDMENMSKLNWEILSNKLK